MEAIPKHALDSLETFTGQLASPAPVPGGGGASALIGAVGIALGDMVGELTVGKKKYAAVEEDMKRAMAEAQRLRGRFLELVDEDARVFEPLSRAYGIPKDDPNRAEIMEAALKDAASVPMEIMRASCEALELIREFAEKGSKIVISDAGCAAAACKAALSAASLNVFINTKSMKDREYALKLEKEAEEMLAKYQPHADETFRIVLRQIGREA